MTRQNGILSKLIDRSIIVEVLSELHRIDGEGGADSELAANITLTTGLVDQIYMKTSI